MRIRKPHRNARREENAVVPIAGALLKGWDAGDGDTKSTSTSESQREIETTTRTTPSTTAATVVEPASGLESASPERSRAESLSPGVSMMPQVTPEGSNLSVDHLWQIDAEHAPRHYVRRSNVARSKPGDAPARMSPLVKGESEELPFAMGASTKSKRNDPLRRTEDSEADSENHPSTAPEGSLLHTLYLQLLAAGSEGITLRELFTSFKKQTALQNLGFDWKEQVRSHLRNNPHFDEVTGHYLLKCVQQQHQQPKRRPAATVTLNRPYMCVSPRTTKASATRHVRTTVQSTESSAPAEKPEGVQTRRKAYEKTIEAVLTESAMEFERMQQMAASSVSTRAAAAAAAAAASDFVTAEATDSQVPTTSSRKRKFSSLIPKNEEQEGCKTIRGSLQAMQAKILAVTGVQKGVPCARKDDARKWRCPLMAMEGHTLCEHHKTLQLRKRVKKQEESKSRRSSTEEETTGRVRNPRTQSSVAAGDAGTCFSTEKEDNAGGAHAVEALVHLQGQRTVRSSNTAEAKAAYDDDAAAAATLNAVEFEEADSKVVIDNHSATKTPRTPAATDHGSDPPSTAVDEPPIHIHYEKAIPGSLKALQAKILAESGVRSGVRCARKDGSNDSARKWQCPLDAMEGHTLCEHHNLLKERKRARYAAAKQTNAPGARKRRRHDTGSNNATQQLDQAPPPRSEITSLNKASEIDHVESPTRSRAASDEKSDHAHYSTDTDDVDYSNVEPANGKNSKEDDDNNVDANHAAERLLPHIFKNAPKRWYVAAKKSAANVEATKEQSQEREASPFVRPPTIPPLPVMYGVRRKVVKNRSLLSL